MFFEHSENPHIHKCVHQANTFSVCGYKVDSAFYCDEFKFNPNYKGEYNESEL